ncbi:uncharacterized protein LOC130757230 isoform X2 [Actinidia eriantha]|uniref:uncharacterized protein LOC130757230 isoform X2 n=1 Tax=Actinidia eriantha TaxID=165200 RepID=UPI00258D664A|nr:uncharacterized protein LOC130757230 isoform X2 [Actinidia eriantha]XP_057467941.1 uncharacterized protein LOC130757230 isoform X2 [Actinidia eriantha]XP_057467942.1 uncharacterized protein LOC130757230 isoform X2 [Actinidia eriantha]
MGMGMGMRMDAGVFGYGFFREIERGSFMVVEREGKTSLDRFSLPFCELIASSEHKNLKPCQFVHVQRIYEHLWLGCNNECRFEGNSFSDDQGRGAMNAGLVWCCGVFGMKEIFHPFKR